MGELEETEMKEVVGEVVRWEKVLSVLLVEADDSTRHILAALLRKCNYRVAAVSDGLKAWELLKRRRDNIDLILTELDLPSISGYALLTLIKEHDGCKNIPVIIMSSQDSISMVLKCMLKGAADFLIKPVRRNELKNLWRHVWRKLAINAGNNSQNLATGQFKADATFENHPASNQSSDNVSSIQKNSKSSAKATDALSSCRTRLLEAESARMENVQDPLQIRHRNRTGLDYKETAHHAKDVLLPDSDTGQKEIKFTSGRVQPSDEANVSAAFNVNEDGFCTVMETEDEKFDPESCRDTTYVAGHKIVVPSKEAVDLIGSINKHRCKMKQSSSNGESNRLYSSPELELTLKSSHDAEIEEVDEKPILDRSSASAFSRYSGNKKLWTFFPSTETMGVAGPFSPWPNAFSGNMENKPKDLVAQFANGEAVSPSPQIELFPLAGVMFDGGVWTSYGSLFQPVCSPPTVPTPMTPNSSFQREESPLRTSPLLHSDHRTQSSGQGCIALCEITNQSSGTGASYDLYTTESINPSGESSIPCNDIATQQKSSTAYGSVSEVTDVNVSALSMMATSALEESVRDDGSNTFELDQFRLRTGHHSAKREAALAKLRLKRKARCFEKKVRYQSRKRLAEQRPRVKGQFVRQNPSDPVIAEVGKP